MIIRLVLIGLIFGLVAIGLLYLLGFWQGGGDDWRDDDDDPDQPPPHGEKLERPADSARPRQLHDADADE